MEMGRARIRRSRRDKIPRVHTTEKQQWWETHTRQEKENNNSNEEYTEHGRKNIQTGLREENEDVESVALFGAEVWGWNMEERLDRIQRR